MKIYLGNNPVKLMVNNSICLMKLVTSIAAVQLVSSDNLLLQDMNGLNLLAEEGI